jgi:succinate dehydrogenase / fumarate reductase, cytochrome b subunit
MEASVATLPAGTLYRGKVGMWSWVFHRISGVGIFFFLLVHILDTALVRVSPEAYNAVMASYKTPVIGIAELGLVAAILFHGLNGLRITAIDFWSQGIKFQAVLFWAIIVITVVLVAGFTPLHLARVFSI